MKAISLENVKDYCRNLKESDFFTYKEYEDQYRQMWAEQGLGFWVKFVVSLKQYITNSSSKYDEKCEKEFIMFLKALTFKKFTELNTYLKIAKAAIEERHQRFNELQQACDPLSIRNVTTSEVESYSQMRALTLKLKCAGAFVNLLTAWKCASVGDDFQFSPPESWTIPSTTAEPLEAFIRAKWSGFRNIDDILGCKKENIAWWTSPARKVDQSKLQPQPSQTSNSCASTSKFQQSGKQSQSHKRSVQSRKHKEESKKRHENVPAVVTTPKKSKASWMPAPVHWDIFHYEAKIQKEYEKLTSFYPMSKLKPLLEYSLLPLLKRKYHTMNATLLAEEQNKQFLGVAPWFVLCCEAFGNVYMYHILECQKEFIKHCALPDKREVLENVKVWKNDRDDDRKVLENVIDKIGAPDEEKDSIESAAEFLLEPCVVIQLPWQPVMLRQWLAAALIEILKFELDSMEFRHWPLSLDVEPIVRELLALVTEAKERILLGWTVMSYAVSMFPIDYSTHRSFIIDQVVLPTLGTLQFLCSGKPKEILSSLKKLAWPINCSLQNKVNLFRGTFLTNGNLAGFYMLFYGNFVYWFSVTVNVENPEPFPTVRHRDDKGLFMQLDQMENSKELIPPDTSVPFDVNVRSLEEENIYNTFQFLAFNKPNDYDSISNLRKTTEVIKNIMKCPHFTPEKMSKLYEILASQKAKETASVIFKNSTRKSCPLEQLILSSILYYEINRYIGSIVSDTSILGCMNLLSARVMEKEQMMRVFAACSILVGESPTLCKSMFRGKCPVECNVDSSRPMDTSLMMRLVMDVKEKNKKQDRKELWSRFPEEWQKDVDSEVTMPTMEDGIPAIVTALEARVGRIVWNATQDNYELHAKGWGFFPYAQVVQYILPSYISILIDLAKFPPSKRNLAKQQNCVTFLCGLVEHYEKEYHNWHLGPSKINCKAVITDVDSSYLRISCVLSSYIVERTSFALHGFVGLGRMAEDLDSLPHFGIMAHSLQEYPMFNSMGYTSKIELINCEAWANIGYPHFQALHQVCFDVMPVPTPDTILYCHELQDFYMASALIHQLEYHYTLSDWFCLQFQDTEETAEFRQIKQISKTFRNWRYELFCIIFETEGKFDYPENMLSMFIEGKGKKLLLEMFGLYKIVRDSGVATTKFKFTIPAWGTVELQRHFELFLSGELQSLKLFEARAAVQEPPAKVLQLPGTLVSCNNCHRTETKHGSFQRCPACLENGYPFPNFFCSQRCQEAWWKTEHMAEHLEFDLGLCDFGNLSVKD